jgi:hypothetical protein
MEKPFTLQTYTEVNQTTSIKRRICACTSKQKIDNGTIGNGWERQDNFKIFFSTFKKYITVYYCLKRI